MSGILGTRPAVAHPATPPEETAPDWVRCAGCGTLVYGNRWRRSLHCCPECGHHGALTAWERLRLLLDPGSLELLPFTVTPADPLGFTDSKPYPRRLAEARARTGLDEAVVGAAGEIDGAPVVVACMDFRFLGGSLGSVVGEIITRIGDTALARRTPLLLVTASGGARMQEGALSLMQMAKTSAMLARLDEAGILTVSLVTDPTFGGVAASFATLCDVTIAEPRARLGFAGRRVVEQTIKETLPPNFQTAEFLYERGFIDVISPRDRHRTELGKLLRTALPGRRTPTGDRDTADEVVVRDPARLGHDDPHGVVRRARRISRPTTLDYAALLLDDFRELAGDRLSGECPAIVGGLGRLDGRPVVMIGHQKGHDPAELARRNFGMPSPAGYRKAARLMRLAAKLGLPVITLIDTPGAFPGRQAEEQGQAIAIAANLKLMAELPVPVVAVVTGEGGSGGALALAVANRVLMWQDAIYSVISPEGCSAILWQDPAQAGRAAAALRLRARDLLELGVVDGVLLEPAGGVDADPVAAAHRLGVAIRSSLDDLEGLQGDKLRTDRHARFARYGAEYVTSPPATDLEPEGTAP
ncbi:acetyl-CoA carboxylase carboxyl transferase subunit alpha [Streptomyces acidiscabies]|uniref:Multifunctional fusion protein n=1 Tax=Streptomyces acidiscabies TaxID=42234 RepID=A0ABU4LS41_9ACTN|nr:acetyl-CoA carboxylase carboxyl transferase subunit alpha [Streptomyces acidiscabies]MDX3018505.1 acetyl-CoA carboxylase carboxyl transferase subunit alpha [Streptomyces acidiscabies]